jgi:hypothetical protein
VLEVPEPYDQADALRFGSFGLRPSFCGTPKLLDATLALGGRSLFVPAGYAAIQLSLDALARGNIPAQGRPDWPRLFGYQTALPFSNISTLIDMYYGAHLGFCH